MKHLPDFPLVRTAKLSQLFIDRKITQFSDAVAYLRRLPYRRTSESRDLSSVIIDSGGSFTARNALLVQLSREQGIKDLMLSLCTHEFDRSCPKVSVLLSERGLESLPDAQGCVQYQGRMFTVAENSLCLEAEVLSAIEIAPAQIGTFKRRYHQNYLSNWMQLERLDQLWSVEKLWDVRAQCLDLVAQQWNRCLRSVC
jgi:hypothetical protein